MAKTRARNPTAPIAPLHTYWDRTQWPLQSLYFLLPLLLLYEAGTLAYAPPGGERLPPIVAEKLLGQAFQQFGIASVYLPGIVAVAVLLCWHLARRDPWQPEPRLYGLMWIESLVLATPLFVFGLVLVRHPGVATWNIEAPTLAILPGSRETLWEPLVFSVGAGIYEELLFRLIAIALIHMILVDLLALPDAWGATAAVTLSALAFALYHFPPFWQSGEAFRAAFRWDHFIFFTIAGVYFAAIYILRGFGIVAATHAIYDVLVVVTSMTTHS